MNTIIENQLRQIIAEVVGPDLNLQDIPCGRGLLEKLQIDSLMILQIIVLIEQQFNVFIDDDSMGVEMLESLESATQMIQLLQQESSNTSE